MIQHVRNYWRRWEYHKAKSDALMWEAVATEQAATLRSLRQPGTESYKLRPGESVECA